MRQAAVGSAHDFTFVDRQASVDGIRTPLSSSTGTPLEESGTKSHKIDNIATKAIAEIGEARRRCGPTGLQVIAMSRSPGCRLLRKRHDREGSLDQQHGAPERRSVPRNCRR